MVTIPLPTFHETLIDLSNSSRRPYSYDNRTLRAAVDSRFGGHCRVSFCYWDICDPRHAPGKLYGTPVEHATEGMTRDLNFC